MIDLVQGHDRDHIVVRVTKDDIFAYRRQLLRVGRQRNGERPQSPIGEAHFVQNALIVCLAHKGGQRRKAACGKQLQVAQVPHGDLDGGQLGGVPE